MDDSSVTGLGRCCAWMAAVLVDSADAAHGMAAVLADSADAAWDGYSATIYYIKWTPAVP